MSGTDPITKDEKVITNPVAYATERLNVALGINKTASELINDVKKEASVKPLK